MVYHRTPSGGEENQHVSVFSAPRTRQQYGGIRRLSLSAKRHGAKHIAIAASRKSHSSFAISFVASLQVCSGVRRNALMGYRGVTDSLTRRNGMSLSIRSSSWQARRQYRKALGQ